MYHWYHRNYLRYIRVLENVKYEGTLPCIVDLQKIKKKWIQTHIMMQMILKDHIQMKTELFLLDLSIGN